MQPVLLHYCSFRLSVVQAWELSAKLQICVAVKLTFCRERKLSAKMRKNANLRGSETDFLQRKKIVCINANLRGSETDFLQRKKIVCREKKLAVQIKRKKEAPVSVLH